MTDLQFAGEFELNEVKIISASGNSIDNITPLEINIYESIFSNSLTGNISVADTNNLLELLPLVGDEELILKMTDFENILESIFSKLPVGGAIL